MKTLSVLAIISLAISCSDTPEYLDNRFIETEYDDVIYEFKKDGTFIYTDAIGSYTDSVFGKYTISKNVISLTASQGTIIESCWSGPCNPLKIISSKCIRDYFRSKYYCTDSLEAARLNELEYKFQDKVMAILDELPIIKKQKESFDTIMIIPSHDIAVVDTEIVYEGITIVNETELHQFRAHKVGSNYKDEESYFYFRVKREPLEIYQVFSQDSSNLVYTEDR